MKKCLLVWQIPVIEGEHYSPILYLIYVRKAKKFMNTLNAYFQENNMDWMCVLDKSACTYREISSSNHQAVVFVPEAKTRQWLYQNVMQATNNNRYYLDYAEYHMRELDKLIAFLNELN